MTGRSKSARMMNRMTDRMKRPTQLLTILCVLLLAACLLPAQDAPPAAAPAPQAPTYTPKYHGDPARSDSEALALAYMRGVMRAQMLFHKQHAHYASSLSQLVHINNFTQRMVNPDRGDYTAGFRAKTDNYILTMTPKNLDALHRSFYAEDDGKIHADETKPADATSQVVETHHW